jgi:hypothetical protein
LLTVMICAERSLASAPQNRQAYRDCRLIYNNLPSPRQIQTLLQEATMEVAVS